MIDEKRKLTGLLTLALCHILEGGDLDKSVEALMECGVRLLPASECSAGRYERSRRAPSERAYAVTSEPASRTVTHDGVTSVLIRGVLIGRENPNRVRVKIVANNCDGMTLVTDMKSLIFPDESKQ